MIQDMIEFSKVLEDRMRSISELMKDIQPELFLVGSVVEGSILFTGVWTPDDRN